MNLLLSLLILYATLPSFSSFSYVNPTSRSSVNVFGAAEKSITSLLATREETVQNLYKLTPKSLLSIGYLKPVQPSHINTYREIISSHELMKVKINGCKSSGDELVQNLKVKIETLITEDEVEIAFVSTRDNTVLLVNNGVIERVMDGEIVGKGMKTKKWNEDHRGPREEEVEE
ncbi:hypothetical protein TL16_g11104 [Triparma laevis f. inornata]|uniref:Uncharacterized protein n=2 Tax=Triparma laevis TaxID=1534972 RepID=A0A9W6Z6N2_9STRA|nr:hypothetical protein TrLO_g9944 [Triparma laevis f. longispina]GMH88258.1 hypothetical protein TL16_g11104 [Triparma laevis f. inornata]